MPITITRGEKRSREGWLAVYLTVSGLTNDFAGTELEAAAQALQFVNPTKRDVKFLVRLPAGLTSGNRLRADNIISQVLVNQRKLGIWSELTG